MIACSERCFSDPTLRFFLDLGVLLRCLALGFSLLNVVGFYV